MFSIICRNIARLSSVIDGMDVPPSSDEKRSWSRSTSHTRSYAVTTQKPGLSTNWSIGLSPIIPAGGSSCHAIPPCAERVEGVVRYAGDERGARGEIAVHDVAGPTSASGGGAGVDGDGGAELVIRGG